MKGILKILMPPLLWAVLLLLVATAMGPDTFGPELPICNSPGLFSGPVDAAAPLRLAFSAPLWP